MRSERAAIIIVLLLAFFLRVAFLPHQYSNVGHTLGNLDELPSMAYSTHTALFKTPLAGNGSIKQELRDQLPIYANLIMAFHPPLYYFLAAGLLLATMSLSLFQQIFLLKLFSVFLGVLGIYLSYRVARKVFGTPFALSLALFMAAWPSHIQISTTLNNYALLLFLAPLFVNCLIRAFEKGFNSYSTATVAVLAGLLGLTHFPALTSVPAALAVMVFKERGKAFWKIAAFLGVFLLVTGGFFVYYKQTYGNYLPFSFGDGFIETIILGFVGSIESYLTRLFLFFFNLFEAHQALPRLFYWLLAVPTIAALFGFARYVWRFRRLARLQQAFLIGGLVALGTLMVPQFLYEGVIYHNAYHGRRLLELLPFAPAFFLLGLKEATDFLKSNWGVNWDWSAYFVYLLFLAINAYYYFS